jgi:4,5-dihydroxyphthalate decarboxylase
MPTDLELTLMLADYHRTRPILSGAVAAEGIKFKRTSAVPGEACLRPVYEEFDIAEMSLSWYVMARLRHEPVIALPIFPLRMFVHPYIFCSPSANISCPQDLKGKSVGMDEYRLTVGLWARGILREFFGVWPQDMAWVTSGPEKAGFVPAEGVCITIRDSDPETLLLSGEIDALIPPNTPRSFRKKDPRIRRVFSDCRRTVEEYYKQTGIFPITHTLVMRESLLEEHPWVVGELLRVFNEAERLCKESYDYPKRLYFPSAVLLLEEEEEAFGTDPWIHGLGEQNRVTLEKFVEYAHEQGYISYRPAVENLFASAEV